MNNGDGQNASQPRLSELIPFQPVDTVITPEVYSANAARLQAMKEAIALYEERNQQGYMRYLAEKQQLEAQVEQGRLAAYVCLHPEPKQSSEELTSS